MMIATTLTLTLTRWSQESLGRLPPVTTRSSLLAFPAGKSLKHYAKAYTTIHVTPTDVSQPPRAFLLTKIDDANGHAFFKESADGGCYVPAAIAGTGDNVIRRHAQSVILHGDSASMTAPSLARNLPSEGQPNWSLVPGRTPMYFETPTHFSGSDPTNQFGEVIKHVVGTQFQNSYTCLCGSTGNARSSLGDSEPRAGGLRCERIATITTRLQI